MSRFMVTWSRPGVVLLVAGLALLASGCGSKKKTPPAPKPVDPVALAVQAPGVRVALIPPQQHALTIVVPPCSNASISQQDTSTPAGSNQIVIPKSSLDQTVAVQPCVQGQKQQVGTSGTVLLSPGGGKASEAQTQKQTPSQQNQLVIPKNSGLTKIIIPPCVVSMSASSSSSSGGTNSATSNTLALPATGSKQAVTAPPCALSGSSSSSSGG
jgi:hypothetical protein